MYVRVFVTPSAKREKVEENHSTKFGADVETLVINTKEPASGNRANTRVREIVAEREGKPLCKVRILTGHRSRSKIVSIID